MRVIKKIAHDHPEIVERATKVFLEEAATVVKGQAKRLVPVDTGNLKGSITSRVEGWEAIVGTNVEYAEYVEYGTRNKLEQSFLRAAIDITRKSLVRRYLIRLQEEWKNRRQRG